MKQAKGYVKCTDVYIMQAKDCLPTVHFCRNFLSP